MRMKDVACMVAVACPACKAQPGEVCLYLKGKNKGQPVVDEPHATRVRRYWAHQRAAPPPPRSVRRRTA